MEVNSLATSSGGLREKIIEIISNNNSLSAKQIYYKLQRQYAITSTYQAMHKTLKQMLNENILLKEKTSYTINPTWVEGLKKNAEQLSERIKSKKTTSATNIEIKLLTTYVEFAKFVIKSADELPNPENKPGICIMKHSWPPLGLNDADIKKITKFLKETTYYDLTTNSTPLDLAFGKTLEKMGKKFKAGSKIEYPYDILCKGDTVIQIIFDKKFEKEFNDIFVKHTQFNENAINDILSKLVTQPTQIQIIQSTNKEFAEKLRSEVLKEFKTKTPSKKV